jgi:hypothetical protein
MVSLSRFQGSCNLNAVASTGYSAACPSPHAADRLRSGPMFQPLRPPSSPHGCRSTCLLSAVMKVVRELEVGSTRDPRASRCRGCPSWPRPHGTLELLGGAAPIASTARLLPTGRPAWRPDRRAILTPAATSFAHSFLPHSTWGGGAQEERVSGAP